MRISKRLLRTYLLSYLVWLFGALLCVLLLIKQGGALPIVALVLACVTLAGLIASRVLYKNHYQLFFIFSIISFAILNVLTIGGLVLEIVYTLDGIPAPYAWVISIINTVLVLLVDYLFITDLIKSHHKNLVESGVIKENEEEEI